MSLLSRIASLLGLSSPAPVAPPGAALAATLTVVSVTTEWASLPSDSVAACFVGICTGRDSL
jgi:hypothetical protein